MSAVVDLGSERGGRGRRQADEAKHPGVEDACEEAGSKMAWSRSNSRVSHRARNVTDKGNLQVSSSSSSFMEKTYRSARERRIHTQDSMEKRGKGRRAHWGFVCVLAEDGEGPERPDFAGD
jgi:hypothetical protein